MSVTMDFTTTAMARPMIVDRTFASFSKNLQDIDLKECRLFINIDPLPSGVKRKKVIAVAKKYFKEVHYNLPKKANFTAAVNWIWSNAESEFIFNLEDDWELIRPVSVPHLLTYFEKRENLFQVILRAYRYRYRTCVLSPSITHRRLYSAVGGNLNTTINPEAQLRGERFGIKMPTSGGKGKKPLIIYPKNSRTVILRDIGRKWIRKTKYKKGGGARKKARFITWEIK